MSKTTAKSVGLSLLQRLRLILEGLKGTPPRRTMLPTKASSLSHTLPKPWPGVLPKGIKKPELAMDVQIDAVQNFGINYAGWDGCGFMGYALLAELAQITEFRRPSEILANEMTRKWGKLVSSSDDDGVTQKLTELEADLIRFNVREVFNKAFELDNFFGIGHVFIDVGTEGNELLNPLLIDRAKIAKGALKAFRLIEPMWTYPNLYNANDPLRDDFYNPQTWFVMGTEVHKTRLLRFVSRPVPDMLKPAYLFGGVSLTQLLQPYVENWLRTRQSVSDITHNFSTPVLATDMDQMTTKEGAQTLALRAQVYNTMRDNQGLLVCDKDKEDFKIEAAPLSSLDHLQAQAIEQMAFPAGSPLVKLFGVTPSGLNASSDGEIRVFYDSVASVQERIGTPQMQRVLEVLQMNRYGEVDRNISFAWDPLWSLDEERAAAVRKTNAETDMIYVEGNVLDPKTVLERLVADPDSPYAGLDVNDLPDVTEEPDGEPDIDLSSLVGQMSARTIVSAEERADRRLDREPMRGTARPARPARSAADRQREREPVR